MASYLLPVYVHCSLLHVPICHAERVYHVNCIGDAVASVQVLTTMRFSSHSPGSSAKPLQCIWTGAHP